MTGLTTSRGTEGGQASLFTGGSDDKGAARVSVARSMTTLGADADEVGIVTAVSVVVSSLLIINNGAGNGHEDIIDTTSKVASQAPSGHGHIIANNGLLSCPVNGVDILIQLKGLIKEDHGDVVVNGKWLPVLVDGKVSGNPDLLLRLILILVVGTGLDLNGVSRVQAMGGRDDNVVS